MPCSLEDKNTNIIKGLCHFSVAPLPDGVFRCSPKIDVFAIGVTLYLMLLGRYPFEDPTNHSTLSTMKNIRAWNFARPQKGVIDSDALNLIENMLAPDPEKRFSLKDIRNHTWVQREREQEILLQEYDEFEKRLQDVRRQKEREEEAKRQRNLRVP